jgi:hypothetical protein
MIRKSKLRTKVISKNVLKYSERESKSHSIIKIKINLSNLKSGSAIQSLPKGDQDKKYNGVFLHC